MKRLHITAEGQTEELFVRKMLTDHLGQYNICTDVRCVMTSRDKWRQDRIFRGGMTNYAKAKNDIVQWLREEKQNSDVFFSTMFDLYALPFDFPGYDKAHRYTDPYRKVAADRRGRIQAQPYHRPLRITDHTEASVSRTGTEEIH